MTRAHPIAVSAVGLVALLAVACVEGTPGVGRVCTVAADCDAGFVCILSVDDGDGATGLCQEPPATPPQRLSSRLRNGFNFDDGVVLDRTQDDEAFDTIDQDVAFVTPVENGGVFGDAVFFDEDGNGVELLGRDGGNDLDDLIFGAVTLWFRWEGDGFGPDVLFAAGDCVDLVADDVDCDTDRQQLEINLQGAAGEQGVDAPVVRVEVDGAGGFMLIDAAIDDPTRFHHVAYSVDAAGRADLYLDGERADDGGQRGLFFNDARGTHDENGGTVDGQTRYTLGKPIEIGDFRFEGTLDEFRIYKAPLTQADVELDMITAFTAFPTE